MTRILIDNVRKPWKDWKPAPSPRGELFNLAEEKLYELKPPSFEYHVKGWACDPRFKIRALRLLLAPRCYHLRHGKRPARLDNLVPEEVGEVPEDPHDGKPIRFSRDDRSIYSVDEDLEDVGS